MKKFLLSFLLWSFVAVIVAVFVDYMVSSGLRQTDLRKFAVWNDIYRGELNSDLLVIGNSMAWNGYNTYVLDTLLNIDSYNLAIDGHFIDYQLLRYETYRRYNGKPKVVLVNVSFVGTFVVTADERYEREQFFPFIFDDTLMSAVAETKDISFFDRHLPLYRYFGYRDLVEDGIASFFGKTKFFDGGMHKGYRGENISWSRGVLDKEGSVPVIVNPESYEILDSFVKEATYEGVKVIIIKYPVYFPARRKFENIEDADLAFLSISEHYDVPILDYGYSYISQDSTNYYDPTHLNKKGSEVFTMQLCHDLDSIGVLKY